MNKKWKLILRTRSDKCAKTNTLGPEQIENSFRLRTANLLPNSDLSLSSWPQNVVMEKRLVLLDSKVPHTHHMRRYSAPVLLLIHKYPWAHCVFEQKVFQLTKHYLECWVKSFHYLYIYVRGSGSTAQIPHSLAHYLRYMYICNIVDAEKVSGSWQSGASVPQTTTRRASYVCVSRCWCLISSSGFVVSYLHFDTAVFPQPQFALCSRHIISVQIWIYALDLRYFKNYFLLLLHRLCTYFYYCLSFSYNAFALYINFCRWIALVFVAVVGGTGIIWDLSNNFS